MYFKKIKFTYPLIIFCVTLFVLRIFTTDETYYNVLFLSIAILSPIFMYKYYKKIYRYDIELLLLWFLILFSSLINFATFKFETVIYSLVFFLSFTSFNRGLNLELIAFDNITKLVKYFIYAFCIVLIVQQVCVLTGSSIFNNFYYNERYPFKLNSLAYEPSHTARYMFVLMLSYINLKELEIGYNYSLKTVFEEDKIVWCAFFYTMSTMGSASAIIFMILIFFRFLKLKNIVFAIFVLLIVVLLTIQFKNYSSVNRALLIIENLSISDENKLLEVDGSAATRIAPILIYIKNIDISSFQFWFGGGSNFNDYYYLPLAAKFGITDEVRFGGIVALLTNYGFISGIVFIIFLMRNCFLKVKGIDFLLFCIIAIIPSGINTQISWAAIMLMSTIKFYHKEVINL